jgi:ribosomal protein S12 methylthiotransferase RimO
MTTESPAVWLTTLGCAKNQVDSDKISGQLAEAGYRQVSEIGDADVVMVNTCAFIEAARQESIDTVLEASGDKRPDARIMVVGCMAQRYGTELGAALPEVDDVVGLDQYGDLVNRLDALTKWEPVRLRSSAMDLLYEVRRPTPSTPYAYVKVAEGCDKPCTFCAIPQFRGAQRSRPPVNIRTEVADLAGKGVGEIVLVAQDLAAYGRDIDAPGGIVDLIQFISDVDGLRRIRLLYLYPREIKPRLISEMASNPLVAPYFDLSLQHASQRLLRAMKRPGSGEKHLELISSIRAEAGATAATRSSFIVGFPGETEADVEELAGFLREARLDWAGFFPYSAEEGTVAAGLDGQVDHDETMERLRMLQGLQDEITDERNAEQIGTRFEVLVDMVEDGASIARSYREAPEIDGVIVLDEGAAGDWLDVEITATYGQELVAEVVR